MSGLNSILNASLWDKSCPSFYKGYLGLISNWCEILTHSSHVQDWTFGAWSLQDQTFAGDPSESVG